MASAPGTTGPGRRQGLGGTTRPLNRPAGTGFGRGGSLRQRLARRAEIRNVAQRVGRIQGQ